MPPKRKAPQANFASRPTLVVDNGAYTIKAGFSTSDPDPENNCRVIPNCVARSRDRKTYVGAQLATCDDFGEMSFRRPVAKGFLVDWECERLIWNDAFFADNAALKCDPRETNLILTEAPNCPQNLQRQTDIMIFEEFQFASYYRSLAPALNAYLDIPSFGAASPSPEAPSSPPQPAEYRLVIDAGYSHTTVTPLYRGTPIQPAIRRLDIGGLFLTNYLKEQVSIRHYNMWDETHLMNEIKEAACFTSLDFARDLERARQELGGGRGGGSGAPPDQTVVVDYVLPDYQTRKRGELRPHDPVATLKSKRLGPAAGPREELLTIGNERFATPELLFAPADVGSPQAGLAHVVLESVRALPEGLRPAYLANVLVVGGTSLLPGSIERLRRDLRQLLDADWPLDVQRAPDPIKATWTGGARLASNRDIMKGLFVTKQEYDEIGPNVLKRFQNGRGR